MRATDSADSPAARTVTVRLGWQDCMILASIRQHLLADGCDVEACTPEAILLDCLRGIDRLQRSLEELDHEQET